VIWCLKAWRDTFMTMSYIAEKITANLSKKRKEHIKGVQKTAVKLAKKHGEDPGKAEVAALFHDICREMDRDLLNKYIKKFDLPKKYMDNESLAHGKIAAEIMAKKYGIRDKDVLNAVRYHTTGRAEMSKLEKILYLADSIEPGRNYPGVDRLRKLAKEDLDKALLFSLEQTMGYVKGRKIKLDKDTLEAHQWLIKKGVSL
jgi:predicted HD superfamily hydrolase involved in NAD metabolism